MLIAKPQLEQAFERISKFLPVSPLIYSSFYSRRTGNNVCLKLETLQPTHSFKVRGAYNAISQLDEEQRKKGVICASGGNHGLGVALVAARLKIPCRVFLPEKTPILKIDAISQFGAEVILHGAAWDEANKLAMTIAKEEGCAYIHPFDDPAVMAGQGTLVLEMLKQIDRLDSIIVSIGGGGLISGVISVVKHYSPKTKVIGVETRGAHSMFASVQAGHIVELPEISSVAESIGAKKTEQRQFDIVSQYVDELLVVEDSEAITSLREVLQEEKILVEPASSCSLAALTSGRITTDLGKNIAVIMCGGNIAFERICEWIVCAI